MNICTNFKKETSYCCILHTSHERHSLLLNGDLFWNSFAKVCLWAHVRTSTYLLTTYNCMIQVNLFQKLSFLNQLTHNMTRDCSMNSPKNTRSKHVVYKYCFECQTKTKKQLLYTTCCELVFLEEFNAQSLVILWVNWCKNEGFWKKFTCTQRNFAMNWEISDFYT